MFRIVRNIMDANPLLTRYCVLFAKSSIPIESSN